MLPGSDAGAKYKRIPLLSNELSNEGCPRHPTVRSRGRARSANPIGRSIDNRVAHLILLEITNHPVGAAKERGLLIHGADTPAWKTEAMDPSRNQPHSPFQRPLKRRGMLSYFDSVATGDSSDPRLHESASCVLQYPLLLHVPVRKLPAPDHRPCHSQRNADPQ